MNTLETLAPAAQYERDGFFLAPKVLSDDLIARTSAHMDAVIDGIYETGIPPLNSWEDKTNAKKIVKIDDTQISDKTILEAISQPEIGRWAAKLTGAKMVQAWVTQLLLKPSGGQQAGNVGWHQDQQYWGTWWEPGSEIFTAWLAISDVTLEAGPMSFVPGSNQWGLIGEGDFWNQDYASMRQRLEERTGKTFEEVPAILPAGAVSFHQRLTLHASGPNTSGLPRRSFAIHLRTENSTPRPLSEGGFPQEYLDNPERCPVIYQA